MIRFFVPGRPQTAGSKSAAPIRNKAGEVVKITVREAGSKEVRERKQHWRADVRDAATSALRADSHELLLAAERTEQGIAASYVFVRRRPGGHMRTGRHAGVVKDRARHLRPTSRPDALKLARAAEDALTGVLWHDDASTVRMVVDKVYADQVGLDPHAEGLYVTVGPAASAAEPESLVSAASQVILFGEGTG